MAFDAEIRARTDKVIANQHANDEALEQYERIERHVDRTGGENQRILEDKLFRVVPTGPSTMKILVKTNGAATDSAEYRKQFPSDEVFPVKAQALIEYRQGSLQQGLAIYERNFQPRHLTKVVGDVDRAHCLIQWAERGRVARLGSGGGEYLILDRSFAPVRLQ